MENRGAIGCNDRDGEVPQKYRTAEHIKITPLYIDFRMNGKVAG